MMLTCETLRQLLNYDPATGVFTWKEREATSCSRRTWNTRYAGKVAGRVGSHGYRLISIDDHDHRAHRLVWLYMTGSFPTEEIDHADCDKLNNRFDNLRQCSHPENGWNRRACRTNRVGLKGVVYAQKGARRYSASIRHNRKKVYLGCFHTPEEAHAAYVAAVKKYHGEFARAA